jgi:hypothetical protein
VHSDESILCQRDFRPDWEFSLAKWWKLYVSSVGKADETGEMDLPSGKRLRQFHPAQAMLDRLAIDFPFRTIVSRKFTRDSTEMQSML